MSGAAPAPGRPEEGPDRDEGGLERLPGVGPRRAALLRAAGIRDADDLVARFPSRHRLLPAAVAPEALVPGTLATVVGEIVASRRVASRRRGPGHLRLGLEVEGTRLEVVLYNQGFHHDRLTRGVRLRVTGRPSRSASSGFEAVHHEILDEGDDGAAARLLVEHPPVAGLAPGVLRRILDEALRLRPTLRDPLAGTGVLERRGLVGLDAAVRGTHRPGSPEDAARAEERLVYNGFLAAALRVEASRRERASPAVSPRIAIDDALAERVSAVFPFALTRGQRDAVVAIRRDLVAAEPMRRLLQGDVGCGKTAVACWAALAVAVGGHQAAMMAPTEALARQLHVELSRFAAPLGLRCGLLLGGLPVAARRSLRDELASGELRLVVGTQALLGEAAAFRRLGLAVVDEQHRFGVLQRLRLVRKAAVPNLLAMSATPIPRTLALTVHADLDHSEIRERPPGRLPVETRHHVSERDGRFDWAGLAARAAAGEKAFVVFPAVESETPSIPSLLDLGRRIARRHFRGVPVAALHGRLPDEEKAAILERFRRGELRVLFTTTVVEVGVDVPDARAIVIVGATRFGLAQLHQLRGRVGRGGERGLCVLLTRGLASADSERLRVLTGCSDGFLIAERDLELRGPGDMMGLRQHGAFPLSRGGDDESLLLDAFEDARSLVTSAREVESIADELLRWSRRPRARGRELIEAG